MLLTFPEGTVKRGLPVQKLLMSPAIRNPPVFQHDDLIRIHDGRESVSDPDGGLPA